MSESLCIAFSRAEGFPHTCGALFMGRQCDYYASVAFSRTVPIEREQCTLTL